MITNIPEYDPRHHADGYWFDEDRAQRVIDFISHPEDGMIRHVQGDLAGVIYDLADWERAIVANLFGWVDAQGRRRYRESLVYLPRKNSKTTLVAAIMCYITFCDGEAGAQNYVAAADRDQASLLYNVTKGMVLQESELEQRCQIHATSKTITTPGSYLRAISSEANTKHGYNAHAVAVDELHAQPNPDLVEVLKTSQGARSQPLFFAITTADFDRDSVCNRMHRYAISVRSNHGDKDQPGYDPQFLPVIYEASIDDDWTDPEVWAKANPNLGRSVNLDWFARECKRAQEEPTYENTFKRLHLNIKTQQDVRWIQMPKWDACPSDYEPPPPRVDVFGGLDLASTTDLAAFVASWRDGEDIRTHAHFWCPEENARMRERKDKVPYLTWAKQGHLTLTPGDVIDYEHIKAYILKFAESCKLKELAIDRWNAAQITTELQAEGLDVVPFGQGFASMSAPSKEAEKLIIGGHLNHGGNPIMRWMAGNVSAEEDAAGNIKPSKKKSTERIDGFVAMIMSLGRLTVNQPSKDSVYKTGGLFRL